MAPILTMRPAPDAAEMRQRRVRGVEGRQHVERMHALPRLDVAVAHGLEREAAGDVDQRIQPAEVLCRRLDRRLRLCWVGQINAADLDAFGRCRHLRGRVIDAGHTRAARQRCLGDNLAKGAERARHDQNLALHRRSPGTAAYDCR
ncbi:hypothetical protein ACVWZR_009258 [Bradyrhizobium sp. i1.3.1]